MIVSRRVALVCALGAALSMCGTHHEQFSGDDASPIYEASAPSGPCSLPFTIDGNFTGYVATNPAVAPMFQSYEWSTVPSLRGKFTYMYSAACASSATSEMLYFINDWFTNTDAPIAPSCFNRFDFFDPGSQDAVELRVYGDHHVTVFANGANVSSSASGAAGFGSSPNMITPHSMFEFVITLPLSLAYTNELELYASDPCAGVPPPPPPPPKGTPPPSVGTECEDPSYLLDEPVTARLSFSGGGVVTTPAPDVPRASGLDKYDASPGDRVVLRGRRFGTTAGHVTVDGIDAQVLMWTDSRIQIVVPSGVSPNAKTQISNDGWSVAGPRIVGPSAPAN